MSGTADSLNLGSKVLVREPGGLGLFSEEDKGGRRFLIDRRQFSYTAHIPERRCGHDRRIGRDRRCGRDRRMHDTMHKRTGVERRSGHERRAPMFDL